MRSILIKKDRGNVAQVADIVAMLQMWLDTISNGDYVLRLERIKKPRTDPQRKLMWLWFTTIAEEWSDACGYPFTKEDVHDAYCKVYFPIQTPKGVMAGQTKDKTSEEMSKFLDFVKQDALDSYGIVLPDPQEKLFNAYLAEHNDFYKYNS